jgi:signal transduction histidine kinase
MPRSDVVRARRGRLAVRIYIYTLSVVVISTVIAIAIAAWTRPQWPHEPFGPPPIGAEPPAPIGPTHLHRLPSPPMPMRPLVLTGLALLGVGLVTSLVFARSLARPLERLAATADAFGKGDHAARTGIDRSDEIGAVAAAFDDMADRTTGLMRSERELMANVSHELRTPLARMRVALDLAAEGDAETAREVTSEIDRDVAELENLVDAVLTSMRMDLAAAPLRRESIRPEEIAYRAAARSTAIDPERTVEVTVSDLPPRIDADPDLLRRAIDNLVDNARKYSDAGAPIELRVVPTAAGAAFEIEDRGIGIADGDLERIFTPFFRTDPSRARGTGGVGLGLSLSKKIVEAHGGILTVRSAVGRGTTFRVEIPARG